MIMGREHLYSPGNPGTGRKPKGCTNKATRLVQQFCREVLESKEYRESLYRRVVTDSLPPALEVMLYAYAYGKPKERVELNVTNDMEAQVRDATLPDIDMEIQQLSREVLELQEIQQREAEQRGAEPEDESVAFTPALMEPNP
jgi:hypothetical protein